MKEETKEKLVKLLFMLRKKGSTGIRREEIPEDLQKAVTAAIQNGLVRRDVRTWKRVYGRTLTSTWLVATVPKSTEDIETEIQQQKVANEKGHRINIFRMMKAEFWNQAKAFPAAGTIHQRLKALQPDDVEGMKILWTKVWEYYGFGSDITQKVYDVQPNKQKDIAAKPHVQGQNFNLDRGEFRQTVKKLLDKGMITPQTQDYILNKINAVPIGNYDELINLRDKVYTYYSVEDNIQ